MMASMETRPSSSERDPLAATGDPQADRVRRTMSEVLECVASPAVARRIVAEALAVADLDAPPVYPRELTAFVRVHLQRAIQVVLGQDAAELVERALLALAERLQAQDDVTAVRAVSEPGQGLASTEAATGAIGLVLVATSDPHRLSVIERAIGERAFVMPIEDLVALVDAAHGDLRKAPLLVVDCLAPTIQPSTMLVVAPELPSDTQVLLWGIDDASSQELTRLWEASDAWLRASPGVHEDEISAMVRSLLDDA
jgi:hypothetical protein